MKHVRQPRGSSLCGQACVAMVLGCSLDEACAIVERPSGTRTLDLVRALSGRGLEVGVRLRPWRGGPLPPLAMLKVKFQGKARFHWVLARNGVVLDPMRRRPRPFHPSLWKRRRGRVTAFLSIALPRRHRRGN